MLRVRCDRPDCGGDELRISERNGVEIDYCMVCRGVWLDRGELDKIIERANQLPMNTATMQQPPPPPPKKRYDDDDDDDDDYRKRDWDNSKKKRKSSWLSELFDF